MPASLWAGRSKSGGEVLRRQRRPAHQDQHDDQDIYHDVASWIANVVPRFLGARGIADALGNAVNQIALAAIDSDTSNEAIQAALAALQANPTGCRTSSTRQLSIRPCSGWRPTR